MDAEHFDFFGVVGGGGFDLFGAGIAEETHADGDGIALLLVALEEDEHFMLAQAFIGDFDSSIVLLGFGKSGSDGSTFNQFIGCYLTGFGFIQKFQNLMRGSSGGGRSEVSIIRFINLEGVLLVIF